ncbi:hypothetical protein ACWCOV_20420 [Kribbella sp. NPDC002412]
MRRHSFARGLLTATTLVTGLLLLGSTPASAQNTELPPVLGKARFTCQDEGATAVAKLRNPNSTLQEYMVGITAGDIHYDYVVRVAARGAELVEFGGLSNGTYLLQVRNAVGDFVAQSRIRVQCDGTPPTGTPTATPTATAPPSDTPTTVPTTGTASAEPSTPVDVPTAVAAGLPGPGTEDASDHGWTIVGAGLLATIGIMIGVVVGARVRRG